MDAVRAQITQNLENLAVTDPTIKDFLALQLEEQAAALNSVHFHMTLQDKGKWPNEEHNKQLEKRGIPLELLPENIGDVEKHLRLVIEEMTKEPGAKQTVEAKISYLRKAMEYTNPPTEESLGNFIGKSLQRIKSIVTEHSLPEPRTR